MSDQPELKVESVQEQSIEVPFTINEHGYIEIDLCDILGGICNVRFESVGGDIVRVSYVPKSEGGK